MSHGSLEKTLEILKSSNGREMINTSFIECLNGTLRERLASLTRKCRHASRKLFAFHTGMYLIGCTYNFCWYHQELSKSIEKGGLGVPCTPAIASGLTDHQWNLFELLSNFVAPPSLLIPKRRGYPHTEPLLHLSQSKPESQKPRVRLRKGALCSTTV